MSLKLYIHIGLPKTGVTLLSYIFENSKNINFLGRPLIKPYEDIWEYLNSNTHFLEKKFYKMKSDRWVDERKD